MKRSLPKGQIKEFYRRCKIIELSVFGAALRDDFRDDSDIDVLVGFDEDVQWSLFDLVAMQDELAAIVGGDVDLLTRRGVEESHNPVRREAILSSARSVYKAA